MVCATNNTLLPAIGWGPAKVSAISVTILWVLKYTTIYAEPVLSLKISFVYGIKTALVLVSITVRNIYIKNHLKF